MDKVLRKNTAHFWGETRNGKEKARGARTGSPEGSLRLAAPGRVVARLSGLARRHAWDKAQRNARRTLLCGSTLAAAALALSLGASSASADHVDLEPIEELGKFFFFDDRLSRREASRRAPPAMSRRSAGPSRSRTSTRRRSGHRVLGRMHKAAGGLRTTVTSRASSVNTRPAPWGPLRPVAPSGTGVPRAAAHPPTTPTARWDRRATSARRSRRATYHPVALTSSFSDRWPIRR